MYSDENKLNGFINNFSGSKEDLRDICMREKETTKKKIEKETENFKDDNEKFSKVEEVFHNTPIYKSSYSQNFKYKLELLQNGDKDFKILKESINPTFKRDFAAKNIVSNIYRVTDNTETEPKTHTDKKSKINSPSDLLLLHGTKEQNVNDILKEGFKPSDDGARGPGIYLKNNYEDTARNSYCYVNEEGCIKRMVYLFACQVKHANDSKAQKKLEANSKVKKSPKTKNFKSLRTKIFLTSKSYQSHNIIKSCNEYIRNQPFLNVFDIHLNPVQVSTKETLLDQRDTNLNKIIGGTFHPQEKKIFQAHHSLVSPAYLIEVEVRQSLNTCVENILYEVLHITKRPSKMNSMSKFLKLSKEPLDQGFSKTQLLGALNTEIIANQKGSIELLKSEFDSKVNKIKQGLLEVAKRKLKRKPTHDSDDSV